MERGRGRENVKKIWRYRERREIAREGERARARMGESERYVDGARQG